MAMANRRTSGYISDDMENVSEAEAEINFVKDEIQRIKAEIALYISPDGPRLPAGTRDADSATHGTKRAVGTYSADAVRQQSAAAGNDWRAGTISAEGARHGTKSSGRPRSLMVGDDDSSNARAGKMEPIRRPTADRYSQQLDRERFKTPIILADMHATPDYSSYAANAFSGERKQLASPTVGMEKNKPTGSHIGLPRVSDLDFSNVTFRQGKTSRYKSDQTDEDQIARRSQPEDVKYIKVGGKTYRLIETDLQPTSVNRVTD